MHFFFFGAAFKFKKAVQHERDPEFVGIVFIFDRDVERPAAGVVGGVADVVRVAVTQLDARPTLQFADKPDLGDFVPF